MGVSKIGGGPPKCIVKIMEKPIKMDDLGVPLFLETPIFIRYYEVVFSPILFSKSLERSLVPPLDAYCFRRT